MSDDLDGELPVLQRLQLRLHLWACTRCRALRASLQRTVELLRCLSRARLDEEIDPNNG